MDTTPQTTETPAPQPADDAPALTDDVPRAQLPALASLTALVPRLSGLALSFISLDTAHIVMTGGTKTHT